MLTPLLHPTRVVVILFAGLLWSAGLGAHEGRLGQFADHTDIGAPRHAGTVAYDEQAKTYTVGGGGTNMWFRNDAFHLVWTQVEGDIALATDIAFAGTGGDPHRKAVLMIRQSLAPDAAYADVAVHGDGLTSLQFRETAGEVTHEVQTAITAPKRLRIEKVGDYVYMSLAGEDSVLRPSGCSTRLPFAGPFYLGIGVCAHNDAAFETAVFSNVVIGPPSAEVTAVRSSLEFVYVASGDRRSVWHTSEVVEAPAWADGGRAIRFNGGGRRHRLELGAGSRPVEEGPAPAAPGRPAGFNPDRLFAQISPDGAQVAFLSLVAGDVLLGVAPVHGGEARTLVKLEAGHGPLSPPSWSPDGTRIAYVRYQPGRP
ncbi:translocation protein TolB [Lacunisphaera limnophila]|uniref:Translocation protein TolB n=1 Tax=Lacunisphaera limnophila TaxID=1838286 RepID=A0A1I7PHY8_9BACT|nr:PD40 domain-containing protein [Lacunisphaera limnophila]AOS43238.1 translocation protein TolB [Lacunisphaera limnophila]